MKRKFTIDCEIDERWVDDFCSMLKYMENCGKLGSSQLIGFISDGDGDFRPKFNINTEYNKSKGINYSSSLPLDIIFDAG